MTRRVAITAVLCLLFPRAWPPCDARANMPGNLTRIRVVVDNDQVVTEADWFDDARGQYGIGALEAMEHGQGDNDGDGDGDDKCNR
uniref:Uncharacterized protein n=1 Tax=Oryza barthii TaxID=65489 RepID=A0A0D3H191_9ORYZ